MSTEPRPAPKTVAEADKRLDTLTDMLSKHWASLDPAETLDRIATLLGQRRALLKIERLEVEAFPAARAAAVPNLLEGIAHRIAQSRSATGAGRVAADAEIAVYIEHLRSEP